MFSRCVAAVLGGYALANTLPVAIVAASNGAIPRADAVLVAMQLSFVVYTCAVMWAFGARSVRAAWAGLAWPALLAGLVAWALL